MDPSFRLEAPSALCKGRTLVVALASVTMLASAVPAQAQLNKFEVKCRDNVHFLARRTLARVLRWRHACVRSKTRGKIPLAPLVECGEDPVVLGGAGTGDAPTDRRLAKVDSMRIKGGERLVNNCDSSVPEKDVDPDEVIPAGSVCDGQPGWIEVGECIVDEAKAAADAIFPLVDLNPPSQPLTDEEDDCVGFVNTKLREAMRSLGRWRSKCFAEDDLTGGTLYQCDANITPPGAFNSTGFLKVDRQLEPPVENFIAATRYYCDQDLISIGWDATIPNRTGGDFDTRHTVDDIQDSLVDAIHTTVNRLTAAVYPVDNYCGDGNPLGAPAEACDDGNNDSGDGCDRDCSVSTGNCGNGSLEGTASVEECDDGNTAAGDGCDIACDLELCGNGIFNPGWAESCDDAGPSQDCDDDCTVAVCGDEELNTSHTPPGNTVPEQCDPDTGLGNAPDQCRDGSGMPLPGFGQPCQLPACGDGVTDTGEDCDEGDNSNPINNGESATCDLDCTTAACGDGTVNETRGEQCDDANASDSDSCPSSVDSNPAPPYCQDATCGDGFVCTDPFTCTTAPGGLPEDCDDTVATNACDANCTDAICGDGDVNPAHTGSTAVATGEECDDDNLTDGDGCDSNCTPTGCGNGVVTVNTGEVCDDGNSANDDGCDDDPDNGGNCTVSDCGNGVVNTTMGHTEECDTAGETAGCDTNCTFASCQDGDVNFTAGEECDDGAESATCDTDCTTATCGDGNTNTTAGETCDDSGESATCDIDCTDQLCGDGVINTTAGEQCDDSGQSADCDTDCTIAFCGDGTINSDNNTPPANLLGETCDDGGESATCDSDCSAAACGDGVLNVTAGEECDDGNLVAADGCDATCQEE